MIERNERLKLNLSLNAKQSKKYSKAIDIVVGKEFPVVYEGDTLNLTYEVNVEYWGQTATRMAAILQLLDDPTLVCYADVEELRHGYSIIVELVKLIEEVQKRVASRLPLAASKVQDKRKFFQWLKNQFYRRLYGG